MLTMHLFSIVNHGYINTLLFMHSLGDVDLRVKITALQFQSSPSQEASLDRWQHALGDDLGCSFW